MPSDDKLPLSTLLADDDLVPHPSDPLEPADEPGEPEAARRDTEEAREPLDEAAPEPLGEAAVERAVAALLFASPDPLSVDRLAALAGGAGAGRVQRALESLGSRLAASGLPYELRAIAGGWQLFTAPDQAEIVARLAKARREERVSPATLETLSIVAYRQPVTKAEIEAIRGVQVGPILRSLVDRGLVRIAGRADVPGHPLLYATTRKFLDAFALASLEELPRDAELLRD
jgi:segregation and condensation protein B